MSEIEKNWWQRFLEKAKEIVVKIYEKIKSSEAIKAFLNKLKALFLAHWFWSINYAVIIFVYLIIGSFFVKVVLGSWLIFSVLYYLYKLTVKLRNKKSTSTTTLAP